jgi:hypothetical protein
MIAHIGKPLERGAGAGGGLLGGGIGVGAAGAGLGGGLGAGAAGAALAAALETVAVAV